MDHGGYIKVWRRILDSEVMQDDWLCRLWLWCLLKARWEPSRAGDVDRGQFITGRIRAAEELKVSPSKWYRGIETLKTLGCIEVITNSNRTTITVCNYGTYQDQDLESEQRLNSVWTASEQLPLDKKERKKEGEPSEPQIQPQNPAADEESVNDTHSPAWLAREWIMYRRGTKGRDELRNAREHFEEMIRLGCQAAQIAAEIVSKERDRTETVWTFQGRVMRSQGLANGKNGKHTTTDADLMGGIAAFANRGTDA